MSDTDGLAAETRRLLDAATKGEWGPTIYRGTGLGWDVDGPEAGIRGQFENEADAELIAAAPRLLANWLARSEQTEAVEDDLGRIANENAALAGRLMAERDRLADENRALREREQGLLDAIAGQDPDQCAVCGDVYCSGAYCLEQMVAELPDEHQELPEPIEKVQDMVRLGRILSEWAAADRGTDR